MTGRIAIYEDRPGGRVIWLDLTAGQSGDGIVTAFCGHVDLGTGIGTALAQIVAEELDLPLDRVRVVLGDTARTPDQGPTIASETIQISAEPLRRAAAQARHFIAGRAASRFGLVADDIDIAAGELIHRRGRVSLFDLVSGLDVAMRLDREVPVKDPRSYRLVGTGIGSRDLPRKVTGEFDYIHDLRLPGMLHGHVVRPPYGGRDSGDFVGRSLIGYDEERVSGMPGFVALVREADFLGVVAASAAEAAAIAAALPVDWLSPPALPEMSDLREALKAHPSVPRPLDRQGDFDAAMARAEMRLERSYLWPYHMHGSIGPSCAVADWNDGHPIVWSGTQNPHMLRGDLAQLVGVPSEAIEVRRLEAAGCYGRNCADDVCGDALLLTRAVGQPVRVQLTRAQEHLWEPKGAAQLMEVSGGLDAVGTFSAYAIDTWYPSNRGPNLALLLTGRITPEPRASDMGDRTIIPPYRIPNRRITVHDMAPIVRAAWMRGVSALPNTFAHESFVDELATQAGEDPVAFRLRHLDDPRQRELIERTAEAAGWEQHSGPRFRRNGRMAYGQGFAYATYVHGTFPGTAAASAAWVCDVAVNTETGEVTLTRVFVGQDQGLVINPDGVRAQIHGNVMQTASRVLREEVTFDAITSRPRSWANYPMQTFDELPVVQSLLIARPEDPALGVGESAAVPAAAAIANAIFDATGVRLREAPFTPERVRSALEAAGMTAPALAAPEQRAGSRFRPRGAFARAATALGGAIGGALTLGAVALPLHRPIPAEAAPGAGAFSATMIERGRQVFAAGDCAVCHTAEGGLRNAGGRPMETPFGTVYSTNITPDPETGLGQWSFAAFDRAMRHGISRDGKNLYPAFPYTAFARIDGEDMLALYAYLQTLPPVRSEPRPAEMLAPMNLRPTVAVWNWLHHDPAPFTSETGQSAEWNRGRYLVEGAGHCSACHSPRNLMGAEMTGAQALTGAVVDGWWAPPLAGPGAALRGWDTDAFYAYLRKGIAPGLAAAAGPMAPVVESLTALPDADVKAMAVYLASLAMPSAAAGPVAVTAPAVPAPGPDSRLFRAACESCHEPAFAGSATVAQLPLSRSAALRAPTPSALEHVVRDGIVAPLSLPLRDMPAFGSELSEGEIASLARYLRSRYAPDLPPWPAGTGGSATSP